MKGSIKQAVRERYASIARQNSPCCGTAPLAENVSKKIGYSDEELKIVPRGANLGLGCGNPVALASLQKGEVVLDLGSGAGFDCFLAAHKVGKTGRVIGVDMTPEMIEKARENARKGKCPNVEFRLGEIENLPVADSSVDAIISNCVINLSPDKARVFQEAFRVLKPGGRMMVSDIVLLRELPAFLKNSLEAYVGCLAGATRKDSYLKSIARAGFQEVKVIEETAFPLDLMTNDPLGQALLEGMKIPLEQAQEIASSLTSLRVSGVKPRINIESV